MTMNSPSNADPRTNKGNSDVNFDRTRSSLGSGSSCTDDTDELNDDIDLQLPALL